MVVLHSKFDQTHYPEITNKGSSQNSKQLTIFESYVYNEPLLKESTTIQAEQIDKKIVKQRAISNQPKEEVQFENQISFRLRKLQDIHKFKGHNKTRSYAEQEVSNQESYIENQQNRIRTIDTCPNFAHMCQTVRQKQNFNQNIDISKRKVRELETQFKDTIKSTRRMKQTLNALFGGLSTLSSHQDKYSNNVEFIPKKFQPEVEVNGGKPQKFQAQLFENFPVSMTAAAAQVYPQKLETMTLFKKVNENILKQQNQELMKGKLIKLVEKLNQELPQEQQQDTMFKSRFLKKKNSDKRMCSQSTLRLIKEYEKQNRLGPQFWQNNQFVERSPAEHKNEIISRTRNQENRNLNQQFNAAQQLMREKFGRTQNQDFQGHRPLIQSDVEIPSRFSHPKISNSQNRINSNQKFRQSFQHNKFLNKDIDMHLGKYQISKKTFKKQQRQILKEKQQQTSFPIEGFQIGDDQMNEWDQLSLKKFELTIN
eukprot:403359809